MFLSISILVQKCHFCAKRIEILGKMLTFSLSVHYYWHCFLLVEITFYAKSVSFWTNEWISKYSDKIMSCKLWGKVTSVSVNINFGAKMSFLCEKNWNFGRNVDFFIKCALLMKVIIFLQNMLIFKTMCQNLIKKNLISWFVYVLIFIKVFNLLENYYFVSKYHFVQW